jgi:hypothetical protein
MYNGSACSGCCASRLRRDSRVASTRSSCWAGTGLLRWQIRASCRRPIGVVAFLVFYVARVFDRQSSWGTRLVLGERCRHRSGCSLPSRLLLDVAWGTQRRSNLAGFVASVWPQAHRFSANMPICRQEGSIHRELPKLEVAGSRPVRRLEDNAVDLGLELQLTGSCLAWRASAGSAPARAAVGIFGYPGPEPSPVTSERMIDLGPAPHQRVFGRA